MPQFWVSALTCSGAFFLGAVPFGFLAGRIYGIDLRAQGSGNIGATNTLRVLTQTVGPAGRWVGVGVLVLDALKGYLPVLVAQRLGLSSWWVMAAGLCAVVGHIYSPFVRFRGGKGVATSLGVLIGLSPVIATATLAVFFAAFLASGKRVSAGSITAALAAVALFWAMPLPTAYRLFATMAALFIVVRHRDNIRRLLAGQEPALTGSAAPAPDDRTP